MVALKTLATDLVARHKENIVHLLLFGSFVALGFRSAQQEREIEALEAEKSALRAANTAASTAMWSWREQLFRLAGDSSPPVISAARLRVIYGEDEPAPAVPILPSGAISGTGNNVAEESVSIS